MHENERSPALQDGVLFALRLFFVTSVFCVDAMIFYCGAYTGSHSGWIWLQSVCMVPVLWISGDVSVVVVRRLYRRYMSSFPADHPMRDLLAMAVVGTLAVVYIAQTALALYVTAVCFPRLFAEGYDPLQALRTGCQIALLTGVCALGGWSFGLKELRVLVAPLWMLGRLARKVTARK